jgi:hypothetical protein
MARYAKETPRITVKFIDADTENVLFEVHNRSWMDVSELFADKYADELIKIELQGKKLPKNIMVLAVCELKLI